MTENHNSLGEQHLPLQVLLIEPSNTDLTFILGMLTAQLPLAKVSVAYGIAEGLEALKRGPNIVIVDLLISEVNGVTLVTTIHRAYPDAALVALNGPADHDVAVRMIAAGADEYLAKGSYDAFTLSASALCAIQRKHELARMELHWHVRDGLLDSVENPICSVDATGIIVAVNKAWQQFISLIGGKTRTCDIGANYRAICHHATGELSNVGSQVADGLSDVLAGRERSYTIDFRLHTLTTERWFTVDIHRQLNGNGAVIIHRDITRTSFARRAMARKVLYDTLTELPTRALLDDRLEQAMAEQRRSGHLVAVMFLDIDQFRLINDKFGWAVGNTVLVEVAKRLEPCVHDGDTLARFGGDQFTVVWRNISNSDEAQKLGNQSSMTLEAPFNLDGINLIVTASIGVAVARLGQTADELLLSALAAMRKARQNGSKLEYSVETKAQSSVMINSAPTSASLRHAIRRDELVLHYQPVVDLTNGTIIGVEALVRWQHPTDGLLGPDLFIPVAESSDQIFDLGEWVMKTACEQAVRWHAQGLNLDMAVNISARHITDPSLLQTLSRILSNTGMEPGRLVLEVTESAIMEDAEVAATVLTQIGSLGVSLAIDDFGTGYSSLVYLKRYPIRALKIDRSFIAGMGTSVEDDAIVASVIDLARAVGGTCIAEGVETQEQFAALRDLECGYAQGWLFGAAVPAEEIPDMVTQCELDLATRLMTMPHQGTRRTLAADERDSVANERDSVANERDSVANERDSVANERDSVANERDSVANERDSVANERDLVANERNTEGDRQTRTNQHDQADPPDAASSLT